ncbi:MAG: hypothetical protein KAI81_06485 [Candidatus Marinimicrobia bacterium]|nr:hypothetical protein [Candidatus Neomarinimicrobiota bacterium]
MKYFVDADVLISLKESQLLILLDIAFDSNWCVDEYIVDVELRSNLPYQSSHEKEIRKELKNHLQSKGKVYHSGNHSDLIFLRDDIFGQYFIYDESDKGEFTLLADAIYEKGTVVSNNHNDIKAPCMEKNIPYMDIWDILIICYKRSYWKNDLDAELSYKKLKSGFNGVPGHHNSIQELITQKVI